MHRNWPITADNVSWVLQAITIIFSNQILILTNYDSFYNDDFCSGCTKANFSYPLVDNRATWVRAREITEILKIPKSLIAENVFLLVFILAQCRPEEVSSKHGPFPRLHFLISGFVPLTSRNTQQYCVRVNLSDVGLILRPVSHLPLPPYAQAIILFTRLLVPSRAGRAGAGPRRFNSI